jgi:hypothetical protein
MAGFMGYRDEAEFARAVDAELAEMHSHSRAGMNETRNPQQQAGVLHGAPGSVERYEQVRRIVKDDNLTRQVLQGEVANRIKSTVEALAAGRIALSTAVSNLVTYTEAVQAPEEATVEGVVTEVLRDMVDEDAAADYLRAMYASDQRRIEADQEEWVRREERRVKNRERVMVQEARRAGKDAESAVAPLHTVPPEVLYDEQAITNDQLRASMRSSARMGQAARESRNVLNWLDSFNLAAEQIGAAPAGPDELREKWRAEQNQAALLTAAQRVVTPEQAWEEAAASVECDKGGNNFLARLEAEAERMSGHTLPHRKAIAERARQDEAEREEALRQLGLR